MSKNEKGFSALEVLLLILVVAVIGFGGYYVWRTQAQRSLNAKSTTLKTTVANKAKPLTYTLSSGVKSSTPQLVYMRDTASNIDNIVSFMQPKDWRDDADTTADGCGIKDCLGQTMIVPANEEEDGAKYPDYFVVTISAFQTTDDVKTIFMNNWQDSNAAAADAYSAFSTTEGIQGFKYDFEPTTPTAPDNKYVEHVGYGVSNGKHAAVLDVSYFNGAHKSFADKNKVDYGQYAATVDQIAKTLHLAQ